MKICPFISHMIGEDQAGVLEVQDEKSRDAKHLFCLKESCRFYRKKDSECSFDVVFERVEAQAKAAGKAAATKKTLDGVTTELNKFWTLQTKSVAELIDSIGETEKNTTAALDRFEKSLAERIGELNDGSDNERFDAIREDVTRLREAVDSREEGMEALSSTMSELVMNIDDRLRELREASSQLTGRVEKLETSLPQAGDVEKWIRDSMETVNKSDDGLDALQSRFETLLVANAKFENSLAEWQERVESRVNEIRDGQSSLATSIEEIASSVQSEEPDEDPGAAAERRRKARKLNNLGVTSFHNGELELARDQFEQAVSLDRDFAECYNNLGLVFTELGEESRARDAFSTAIRINPELHAAYNNLGYVYYKQGEYEQAVEMYNEALGRSASNSSAYTNLGNAYYKQGKRDDARAAWEKAIELDPANRQASRSLKELERETV